MRKAKIGIAANILTCQDGMFPGMYRTYVNHDYVVSLQLAGCVPVLLPVVSSLELIEDQLTGLDGVILSGGYDIMPELYGEQSSRQQGFSMRSVDVFDLAVIHSADRMGIPLLGICRGIQMLNVAYGGSLYQDLASQCPHTAQHFQQLPRQEGLHPVQIKNNSFLAGIFGEQAVVNSFHHQAVNQLAQEFQITAQAPDGVVEGIERKSGTFMLGVQWHPEMMAAAGSIQMLHLFQQFAKQCLEDRK